MNEPTSSTSSDEPRILFFDTNFIRALLKGEFNHLMDDPDSDLRISIRTPFAPWRTPFSFAEWIGLNSKSLQKPEPFNPTSLEGSDFIVPAYRHYEKHYDSVRELDSYNLEALAERQARYVDPRLCDIWETMIGGIFGDRDVSDWLRFAFAFDAVHKLDVTPDSRGKYWSDLIAGGFFKVDSTIRNLSKFRLAYQIWLQTKDRMTARGAPAEQKDCVEDTQRLLSLGNWKDYLDGDLVHVATYGVESLDGTRRKAVCLTCDRPEVVVMRIRLYKGLLSYVRKLYPNEAEAEGCATDYESRYNGEILCFDPQGNLVRRIDVAFETPSLLLLGTEPL